METPRAAGSVNALDAKGVEAVVYARERLDAGKAAQASMLVRVLKREFNLR